MTDPEKKDQQSAEGEADGGKPSSTEDAIDLAALDAAVEIDLEVANTATSPAAPVDNADQLDEIAEDMLDLLTRVRKIENGQLEMQSRLEHVARSQAMAVDALRNDLLGERKAFVGRSAFSAIMTAIDSFKTMSAGLDPTEDQRTIAQLTAVVSSLTTVVQSLGFFEFTVSEGEPFDPNRMECLGVEVGEPGVVLKVGRLGYATETTVVRPCGVFIADPASGNETSKG